MNAIDCNVRPIGPLTIVHFEKWIVGLLLTAKNNLYEVSLKGIFVNK